MVSHERNEYSNLISKVGQSLKYSERHFFLVLLYNIIQLLYCLLMKLVNNNMNHSHHKNSAKYSVVK